MAPRLKAVSVELSRLQSLGARVVDDRPQANPGGWVVMADPEGNEFCGLYFVEDTCRERPVRYMHHAQGYFGYLR